MWIGVLPNQINTNLLYVTCGSIYDIIPREIMFFVISMSSLFSCINSHALHPRLPRCKLTIIFSLSKAVFLSNGIKICIRRLGVQVRRACPLSRWPA